MRSRGETALGGMALPVASAGARKGEVRRLVSRFKELVVFMIDAAMIIAAVFVATGIRYDFQSLGYQEHLLLRGFVFAGVTLFGLYFGSFYDFSVSAGVAGVLRKVLVGLILASTLLWALYYLVPEVALGRGIYGITMAMLAPALLIWRLLLQSLVGAKLFRTDIVVLGDGTLARQCAQVIRELQPMGLRLKGFLVPGEDSPGRGGERAERHAGEDELDAPVLGTYDRLLETVQQGGLDMIVVAAEERRGNLPMMDLLESRFVGADVVDGLSFFERHTQKVYIHQVSPSWLIFNKGFNISPLVLATKRLLDLVLGTFALVLFTPVILLTGLLVKLSSPGPMFYKQTRVGLNGRHYTIIKLRSMREPGPQGDDGRASGADDPNTWNPEATRITRLGAILRKLHLDELPQLINVVRGDMSLVGPRPERPEYIAQLEQVIPFYRERHIVRPGVTGLAQVMYDYGASIEGSKEKLQYDLSYIRNLSIIGDLIIMLKTVQMLVLGREQRP